MSTLSKSLKAAAGNAGGDAPNVEDVFSTDLWIGDGQNTTTRTITNGIDLANEGGMVWFKNRESTDDHCVIDTVRGLVGPQPSEAYYLNTNTSVTPSYDRNWQISWLEDGWSFKQDYGDINGNNQGIASWTFRKAPRFFDVVTYTGDSVYGREIPHDLGCDVGMMIVKCTNTSMPWAVYHRNSDANPEDYYLNLDTTAAKQYDSGLNYWNQVQPTSTNFTVGNGTRTNNNGYTYVAYLFAHDPVGEDNDGMIACGSYTGDGTDQTISLGWEPQYVLVKNTTTGGQFQGWLIMDSMRGLDHSGGGNATLTADNSGAEGHVYGSATYDLIKPIASGFIARGLSGPSIVGTNGDTYIYMAIRGPMMKEPEAGTEVFAVDNSNASDIPAWTSGFPVDMVFWSDTTGDNHKIASRLTGARVLETDTTGIEVAEGSHEFDYSDGFYSATRSSVQYAHMFKRAKGFFDVVAYTGTGVARTVPHSLGVVPEMMWVMTRNTGSQRNMVYHKDLPITHHLFLDDTHVIQNDDAWNSTTPTETEFSVKTYQAVNTNGNTYIAYLFASVDGVSKVGSYTGNGSALNIACGFSAGARFILIKRTDALGDWYVWDSTRGINVTIAPHLSLNTTAAEVTTDHSIDPQSAGFIVNQNVATNINVTNGTYIFLAIA